MRRSLTIILALALALSISACKSSPPVSNGTATTHPQADSTFSQASPTPDSVEEFPDATTGEKNALEKARSYLQYSNFSYSGLIGQLEFEKFSTAEATFAADNCGADWNEQAAGKAANYLKYSAFSRDSLIEQLEYEGFTHEQAVYGAAQNGY